MKKIILMTAVLIAAVYSVSAQFSIGPKVGLNLSEEHYGVKAIDDDIKFKPGLNAGLFGRYEMNHRFDIQMELLYSQQGYKATIYHLDFDGITLQDGFKVRTHYLNIPLLLKYYPLKRVYIEAGPQVGFCMNAKFISDDDEIGSITIDDYKKTDFAVAGGVGFYLGYGVSFNARYIHGFIKTLPDTDFKNRVFQFSLAYDLWNF